MTSIGLIRRTTGSEPFFDEPFVEIINPESYPANTYQIGKVFHFNSLKDTKYQEMFAIRNSVLYSWMPQRIIKNFDSKVLQDNFDFVVENKVRCLWCVDGYFWVINDRTILDALSNHNVQSASRVATPGLIAPPQVVRR